MKCVCGYSYYNDFQIEDMELENIHYSQGEKPFLRSSNNMVFERGSILDWNHAELTRTIYACPDCGTLKIEI